MNRKSCVLAIGICLLLLIQLLITSCQTSSTPSAPSATSAPPAASSTQAAAQQPIKIKSVTFLPIDNDGVIAYKMLADRAKQQSNGGIVFDFAGGPEVMGREEMYPAIMKGAVDMIVCPSAQIRSIIPEVLSQKLSEISSAEERSKGYVSLLNDLFKKNNIFFLGAASPYPMYLYCNKQIKTPKELSGMKMRTTEMYDEMMPALGIVGVSIPPADIYSGLERGVIDGFGWSGGAGFVDSGWHEVCKYMIFEPFFKSDTIFAMSLNTWNRIPQASQNLLNDIITKLEPEEEKLFQDLDKKEQQRMKDKGMQFITFSPGDSKGFHDTIYNAGWAAVKAKVSAETYDKLKKMLSK